MIRRKRDRLAIVRTICSLLIVFGALTPSLFGDAAATPPLLLQDIGITQRLGAQVPLDIVLRDENGQSVRLADLRKAREGKPVILALVYYQCPMLCTLVLNDLLSTLKTIPQTVGDEYDVWTVSFDPKETPALATKKKVEYLRSYNRVKGAGATAEAGWKFFTADADNIKKLTAAVGFRYKWDNATVQYVHPAGIMMLTPDARLARYFFGIDFDPTDIRLSLVEASGGKIATPTDKLLLYCYHYDPMTGKYGLAVANTLRGAAALTVIGLGAMVFALWRFDRRRTRQLMRVTMAGKEAPA